VNGQAEYCPARMARLSDVTPMCHAFAMNELIGHGNRTLPNGNGEINFCQRPADAGLTGAKSGTGWERRDACRSIRKVRIALLVRQRLK
jgi:hypothetical protein